MCQRQRDTRMEHMLLSQNILNHPGKRSIGMHISIRHKIFFIADFLFFQSIKRHTGQIFHIDKGYPLRNTSYGEIKSGLNALYLQEIIPFARSIDSRRTENHIRKGLLPAHIILGFQLALSVGGIRTLRVGQPDRRKFELQSVHALLMRAHRHPCRCAPAFH